MNVQTVTGDFATNLDELEDPFSALGGTRFVKKPDLAANKTIFDIVDVEGPVAGRFGQELVLTIVHTEYANEEPTRSKFAMPYTNKDGIVGPRTEALLSIQRGIALGRTYRNYMLVDTGKGQLIQKAA
jgi:hypothetical protein